MRIFHFCVLNLKIEFIGVSVAEYIINRRHNGRLGYLFERRLAVLVLACFQYDYFGHFFLFLVIRNTYYLLIIFVQHRIEMLKNGLVAVLVEQVDKIRIFG